MNEAMNTSMCSIRKRRSHGTSQALKKNRDVNGWPTLLVPQHESLDGGFITCAERNGELVIPHQGTINEVPSGWGVLVKVAENGVVGAN